MQAKKLYVLEDTKIIFLQGLDRIAISVGKQTLNISLQLNDVIGNGK